MNEPEESAIPEAAPPEPSIFQRIEADMEEAVYVIEAIPAKVESKAAAVEAAVEEFWVNFVRNASPQIPTEIHNYVMAAKNDLKAKIQALF